jgi:hypothetical protein
LLWTGTGGAGGTGNGPLTLVCDVDMDGSPDVVAGNTVYRADGTILCDDSTIGDGYNAVADFDGDAQPEIVLVTQGDVYLLEQDPAAPASLRTIWGPVAIPQGGTGGPPTVADYDGDGLPEIGVAANSSYTVSSTTATVGAGDHAGHVHDHRLSVFDFNGDGLAEVITATS